MSARATWRLESLGFPDVYRYTPGKVDWLAAGLPQEGKLASMPRIGDVANREVPTCGPGETVGAVRRRLQQARENVCVVLNERRVVLGLVREGDLGGDADRPVEAVMDPGPVTHRPDSLLTEMVEHTQASEGKVNRTLVTTADGELIGLLRRTDAERAQHATHTTGEEPTV